MALPVVTFSADLLTSWAQSRNALTARGAGASASSSTPSAKAPWDAGKPAPASQLVTNAMSGRALFDASTKKFSGPGVTADARKLFALHSGLNTLSALTGRYDQAGVSDAEKLRLERAFNSGAKQLNAFLSTLKLDGLTLSRAAASKEATSTAAVKSDKTEYVTRVIRRGDATTAAAEFEGTFKFGIDAVDKNDDPVHVDIDLADMGSQTRSLTNVVRHINSKLSAAGLETRFEMVQVSKASATTEEWALKVDGKGVESFSFTANGTAPALYVAGGDNNLLKLQDTASGSIGAPAISQSGTIPGALFNQTHVGGDVRASAVGPDGSYYVVADATKALEGQPIKGARDVALFKYDSAGKLLYTRTLGAAEEAQGFAINVAADGRIAVAGSVKGVLTEALTGLTDVNDDDVSTASGKAGDTQTDSFVSVFDEDGLEEWTARRDSKGDDRATAVTFGADGSVYVAGAVTGDLAGTTSVGGVDSYLRTYSADGLERSVKQFGTSGDDGAQALVVETVGSEQRVTVGSVENGKLVLRQFNDDGAAVTAGTTRDLGSLVGGKLSGLALDGSNIYVAGVSGAGGLNAGTVARAYSGGKDGFVAKLSSDLTASGSDRISYVGGTGDDTIAGISASGGQVWLAGDSKTTFNGDLALGERDGFVARLDTSGALAWTQRFTQKGGDYSATTFAFDAQGASALDRLGLPQGETATQDSDLLVDRTSLRAGDQFRISINGRSAQTITIRADDTMQKLADRIERALLSDGEAKLRLATKGDTIAITASSGDRVDILSGPAGRDALAGLGIEESTITAASKSKSKKKTIPNYGLGLDATLDITTALGRKQATQQIGTALSAIQKAYRDLSNPSSSTSTEAAPAYLTARLKNYQDALARLQSMSSG